MCCRRLFALLLGLPLAVVAHPAHEHGQPADTRQAQASASPWWPEGHSAGATDPQWLETLLRAPHRAAPTPGLADVAAGTRHLVLARATAHEQRDDGRLGLTALQIVQDFSGQNVPPAAAGEGVTMADAAGALRQAALPVDQPLLLLLDPAPDHSYLRGHGHQLLVRSHPAMGHFVLDRPEQAVSAASWLRLPGNASAATLRLALLDVIADGHRLLSRHALSALHQQQPPARLSAAERSAIRRIMQHQGLPARLDLADLLAAWRLPETAELIDIAAGVPPATGARLWRARHRLGAGPPASLARRWAAEDDPETRAAGAWLLAMNASRENLAMLTQLLQSENDIRVRLAIVEALALLPREEAEAPLAIAFDTPHPRLRHAVARQLFTLPAERNVHLLSELILDGTHPVARQHAARLLVTRIGTADARAQMLAYVSQDTELRRILRDGLVRKEVLHLHGEGHSHGLLPAKATDRQWQGLAVELRKRSNDAQR